METKNKEKRPPHEIVLEKIGKRSQAIIDQDWSDQTGAEMIRAKNMAVIHELCIVLEEMIIPPEHKAGVIVGLKRIRLANQFQLLRDWLDATVVFLEREEVVEKSS